MGAADPIAEPVAESSADVAPPTPAQAAALQFRCDNCGAPVTAKPGADALVCDHCGHQQAIARKDGRIVEYDFEAALREAPRGSATDLATGGHEVECKGCGARTVVAGQSQACPFCGSPLIADLKSDDKLILPESLLPHRVTRDEAKQAFQKWLRSRWFAPGDLARRAKASGLDGVMLPHWTYDSHTTTSYHGLRGDHYWVSVSYTDSKGNSRTRMERRTRWSHRSGSVYVPFDDVLVCASRSLPAKLVRELEPWDLGALQPFDPAYLAGHVTERYQIDLAQGFDLADERMRPQIRSAINRDIGGDVQQILSMDVTHRDVRFKHLLLPLWISTFRYRERVFRIVVNARTGEVQGERPYSWVKILLFSLFCAALIGAGIWLYLSMRQPAVEDDGGYQEPEIAQPAPAPVPVPPAPPPPRPPVIDDPLARLDEARTLARRQLADAALVELVVADVDGDGTARGEATYFVQSAQAARRGKPCLASLALDGAGVTWHGAEAATCATAVVRPPTCSLAAVMARIPASGGPIGDGWQLRYAAPVPVEAPAPRPGAKVAPVAGEWTARRDVRTTVIADDCEPPPPPPAARPVRPAARTGR